MTEDTGAAPVCHLPACVTLIPDGHLLCRVHWMRLPRPYRSSVWITYKRATRSTTVIEDIVRYREAVAEATALLERLEPLSVEERETLIGTLTMPKTPRTLAQALARKTPKAKSAPVS